MIRRGFKIGWLVLTLGSLLLGMPGCVAEVYKPQTAASIPVAARTDAPTEGRSYTEVLHAPSAADDNLERLARLHSDRSAQAGDGEYVLGPGDVLSIGAFDFQDLNRRVRVDDDGTITLPLLERVPVGGKTVSAVQGELTTRLGAYMYDPHVSVFIDTYGSQQVAVLGAVKQPGLVTLTTSHSKILDAISAAGGMTDAAGGRIYLMPAEERRDLDIDLMAKLTAEDSAATTEALQRSNGRIATNEKPFTDGAPIMLDTRQVPQGVESVFFNLPVRAGDVIIVAGAGRFIVEGWVDKPGTYPLHPGLTLRGALATSGGLSFPAKKGCIRIYRLSPAGGTEVHEVNYSEIVQQVADDVFIREGDVIEVASSTAKLVPYGFYRVITDIIRVGAKLPLIP